MLSFSGSKVSLGNWMSFLILVFILREVYIGKNMREDRWRKKFNKLEPIWVGIVAMASLFFRGAGDTFIYFQF